MAGNSSRAAGTSGNPVRHVRNCTPGELDLIVLPGAAFTRDGRRLGYGGGFYDTLLAGPARDVPLAGVCFPCQLLDDLPVEPHDKKADMVVTSGME